MQAIRKALAVHLSVLSLILTGLVPLAPTISYAADSCSYPNDQRLDQAQRDCVKNAAKVWRCDLNRCINSGEAQTMREDFKKCAEMADDTARKDCHDSLAKEETAVSNDESGPSKGLAGSAAVINGANALMMALSGAGKSPGGECLSRKVYMGASIVSVLAELYLQLMAEKKLKKLKDDYSKEQASEEAHAAQLRALEYLKEEQETIAKLAKTRATAYKIQIALYAATFVITMIELAFPLTGLKPCLSPEDQAEKDQEIEEKELKADQKELAADKEALGDRPTETGAKQDAWDKKSGEIDKSIAENDRALADNGVQKDINSNKKTAQDEKNTKADKAKEDLKADDKKPDTDKTKMDKDARAGTQAVADAGAGMAIGKWLGTTPGIATISGISTIVAGVLMSAANKQEEEASANAGEVQKTIDKFKGVMDSSGYCSPAQREDLSNPQCYCYEGNGDKNMNRSNSDQCQALWAQSDRNYMVAGANYDGKGNPNLKVCMLINGQVDKACKCRQMINKTTGKNACMQVPMGSNSMGNLGTALGIPQLSSTVGSLAGGQTSFGQLDGGAIGKQAIKNRKMADQSLAKKNAERVASGLPPMNPFSPKVAKNFMSKLSGKQLSLGSGGSFGSAAIAGRPKSGALANAIKAADSKIGLSKKSFYKGKSRSRRSSGSKKADDFAFMNSAGGGGGGQVANYMDKKYDYKSNDIVKNKGVSIWKVISARYSKSAMRRLFSDESDEKGK